MARPGPTDPHVCGAGVSLCPHVRFVLPAPATQCQNDIYMPSGLWRVRGGPLIRVNNLPVTDSHHYILLHYALSTSSEPAT